MPSMETYYSTTVVLANSHNLLLVYIIVFSKPPFVLFNVYLLACERTTTGDSPLTLAVVRAKACAVAATACAATCLSLCSAAANHYI